MEDVEQGLRKPCFTANVLIPILRSKSPFLYDRTMPIIIHYFSDSKTDIKKDCYEKGEQIVECLEYLPFEGGLIRGEDISWQITEGVLQVFITYKVTTRLITEPEETLETFENNVTHKQ